jgi:hypothetical protein
MMTELGLTNEEKIGVIESHIKNVQYNKFNAELTIIEENVLETPNAEAVQRANASIATANAQIAALEAQIAALTE